MPLGYVLKTEDILAYYGLERKDIAEAIFKYGSDRNVTMTTEPGALGRGGGQPGFQDTDEILAMARQALEGMEGTVPRRYPAFHGTLAKLLPPGGIMRRPQKGADLVFDIDVKGNYREAFGEGRKILDFLDSYNVPYRVKFSGGSGPHIIIPYEAFPDGLSGGRFERTHKQVFQIVSSRSRAGHVDGSFTSFGHFYRMPYSLNENTGLVSLPLSREQYDDFTPSMAEIHNVQVNEEWFQEPDEAAREALAEMIRDGTGGPGRRDYRQQERQRRSGLSEQTEAFEKQAVVDALEQNDWVRSRAAEALGIPRPTLNYKMAKYNIVPPGESSVSRDLSELDLDDLKKLMEEHSNRLKRLVELGAPSHIINDEKRLLQEAAQAMQALEKLE